VNIISQIVGALTTDYPLERPVQQFKYDTSSSDVKSPSIVDRFALHDTALTSAIKCAVRQSDSYRVKSLLAGFSVMRQALSPDDHQPHSLSVPFRGVKRWFHI